MIDVADILTSELRALCPDIAAKIEEILRMVDVLAPAELCEHSEAIASNRALALETLRSMARAGIAEAKGTARPAMDMTRAN